MITRGEPTGRTRGTLKVYLDSGDAEWRWQFKAVNGNILADGGEGYSRRARAVHAADAVIGGRPDFPVRLVVCGRKGAVEWIGQIL
jgi:uncharacterized protein YegP (UPF0339 family)